MRTYVLPKFCESFQLKFIELVFTDLLANCFTDLCQKKLAQFSFDFSNQLAPLNLSAGSCE